jgi:predicted glycogen debranching enzyme
VASRLNDDTREWIEADGLGGFASGTVSGVRARRYHGLLLTATTPPTGRVMLVNGFDAWIETAAGRFALSSQRYAPDVVHPDGAARIESFSLSSPDRPWPVWIYRLDDGTRVRQEIIVPRGRSAVVVTWRLLDSSSPSTRLIVRPFLSGRDYHATHHENGSIATDARIADGVVVWGPYEGLPSIVSRANARYEHQPDWYRRFFYTAERERGLDDTEDLFSPGWLIWDLGAAEAMWCLSADDAIVRGERVREEERARRATFASPLHRAADAYLVRRREGRTIVAGYPWFTDWGRDTFIAIRGLCLSTGRYDDARDILLEWSGTVSDGMLPNRFPDAGDAPEFNAVDASLWFVAAVQDFLDAVAAGRASCPSTDRDKMRDAVQAVLEGYARGTRYGIKLDDDGLLACGVRGVQLTWMDARVGDRVITPRIGKPVEIQALWMNALLAGVERDPKWLAVYDRARVSFEQRFWNEAGQCLYDVVDVDHERGRVDASFRPNQIFAIGGLPHVFLDPARARLVVDAVERELVTPLGLRSLARSDPAYVGHYGGGPDQRDAAYHQGPVWPWLMGAFVEGWLRVREMSPAAIDEARDRFVSPLLAHLEEAGLGHVSEIADPEPPFTPSGCPFQAWSLGELIRTIALLDEGPPFTAGARAPRAVRTPDRHAATGTAAPPARTASSPIACPPSSRATRSFGRGRRSRTPSAP